MGESPVPAAAGHAAPTKLCSSHCVKRRRTASSAAADAICAHTARPRPLALPPVQAINPYFWHAFFTRTHLAHPQELPDVERAESRHSRATKARRCASVRTSDCRRPAPPAPGCEPAWPGPRLRNHLRSFTIGTFLYYLYCLIVGSASPWTCISSCALPRTPHRCAPAAVRARAARPLAGPHRAPWR